MGVWCSDRVGLLDRSNDPRHQSVLPQFDGLYLAQLELRHMQASNA